MSNNPSFFLKSKYLQPKEDPMISTGTLRNGTRLLAGFTISHLLTIRELMFVLKKINEFRESLLKL